jgi:hypothetical protein
MRLRAVSAATCCAVALSLLGAAHAAGKPGTPHLLTNRGRDFQVRPAAIVVGMVEITGPHVAGPTNGSAGHIRWSRWASEADGRGEAWVPDGPGGAASPYAASVRAWRVRGGRYTRLWWAYRLGSHRYQEWDQLMRFGGAYDWRVMRFTSGA